MGEVGAAARDQMTSGMDRRRMAMWSIAALGVIGIFGYFLLPSAADQNIAYVGFGAGSTVAMLAAVRLTGPADRTSWYLLIAANAASTIGDFIENVLYGIVWNKSVPFPSVADVFYLAAYPCIFLGLLGLCRSRDAAGRRENLTDATIVGLAAMAVSWHFVMGSTLYRNDLSSFGKVVELAYPMMDIGLLFIMMKALAFGSGRLPYHRIVAVALTFTLISDSAYDYMVQHGGYATGNIIDAGWLLNYVLMAVAAFHPSTAQRAPERTFDPAGRSRVPMLAFAGVIPGALRMGNLTGHLRDTPELAATTVVVFALVCLRMSWLFEALKDQSLRAKADAAALAEALEARDRLEFDLRHQASHDPLTGLANRALLYERVRESLTAPNPSGQIGLCFCDLDGFKTVNDSLGHHAGDELLTVVSQRLQSLVRGNDTVARLGGDEFAVLLHGVDSEGTAMRIADRIVAAMREPVEIAGRQITLSVSVGLAFAEPSKSTEQLLSEADVAMYEAKSKGKSRWASFETAMRSKSVERLELANAFRGALEREEFYLVYQPHFSVRDGRLEGFEALVRWNHPTLGLVPPDRFIPLSEETGFIIPLGRWVLERACEQAALWESVAPSRLTMSVNISGRQLQDASLCEDVRTALALTGLSPGRLILEVTETNVLGDSEEITSTLSGLKAIGVQVALDDFGTGYSSLSYLRRLPLDVLKIDKSFVDPLVSDGPQEMALVSTIIDFAHVLGLRTVAEGVETATQLARLRTLGCSSVQGFLLSGPLAAEAATELIAEVVPAREAAGA